MTSHHCDPGQVLNVADAASPCCVHSALTIPMQVAAPDCKNLQELARSLRLSSSCRSKCHFPQGRAVEPRELLGRLPREIFSQRGQEMEDKSSRTLAIEGTTLRHIVQSPIIPQEHWVSIAHNRHLLIIAPISHLHFILVPFGITTLHLALAFKAWLRVCFWRKANLNDSL